MFVRFITRKLVMIGVCVSLLPATGWKVAEYPNTALYSNSLENPSKMAGDILGLINQHRQNKGLAPLQMNNAISAEAEKHSSDMAARSVVFGHDGFENRVKKITQQIGGVRASAENVANGQLSAKEVVEGWLKSPGHRRNIEGNFTLTGIGVVPDKKGTLFYTQIFVRKA
ncbi:MAG TPA: CAP domain-containing protein [Chitinophagaceae bacterium]|jgi:uncharacterized protein YkwD|nr:CAP domain-containing protein [Chitinophagaceae bacterium]